MSDCIGQTCGSPFAYAIFSFHPGYFRPRYVKKKRKSFLLKTLKTLTSGQPEKYSRCHKTWFQWKPSPTFEIYIVYIAHWDRLT